MKSMVVADDHPDDHRGDDLKVEAVPEPAQDVHDDLLGRRGDPAVWLHPPCPRVASREPSLRQTAAPPLRKFCARKLGCRNVCALLRGLAMDLPPLRQTAASVVAQVLREERWMPQRVRPPARAHRGPPACARLLQRIPQRKALP